MSKEYTHELHREVRSISGGYTLEREDTIKVDGKTVLYVVETRLQTPPVADFGDVTMPLSPDMW